MRISLSRISRSRRTNFTAVIIPRMFASVQHPSGSGELPRPEPEASEAQENKGEERKKQTKQRGHPHKEKQRGHPHKAKGT